jgi:hypothetical protein
MLRKSGRLEKFGEAEDGGNTPLTTSAHRQVLLRSLFLKIERFYFALFACKTTTID